MNAIGLTAQLSRLGLSKALFARMIGVTHRAVNMWISGEREVPGLVEAYLRLLSNVPAAVLAQEMARFTEEDPSMYEGLYSLTFQGRDGGGYGVLVLQGGTVYGSDVGGVAYDGTYKPSACPGALDVALSLTVPAGVPLVTGIPPQPAQYVFPIAVKLEVRKSTLFTVAMPFGPPVSAVLTHLRDLPKAA